MKSGSVASLPVLYGHTAWGSDRNMRAWIFGLGKESTTMARLLSVRETGIYTGLSPHTLYTMVSQRRIPYVKVGRLTKFDVGLLDAWLKQHTVMPMPEKRG